MSKDLLEFTFRVRHEEFTFTVAPSKDASEEKNKAIKEHNLVPKELVGPFVEYIVNQELTSSDKRIKKVSRGSKYFGMFIGIMIAPAFLTVAVELVGSGAFALILAGAIALPLFYVIDKTVDSTLTLFKERSKNKNLKLTEKKEDGNDEDQRDGEGTGAGEE